MTQRTWVHSKDSKDWQIPTRLFVGKHELPTKAGWWFAIHDLGGGECFPSRDAATAAALALLHNAEVREATPYYHWTIDGFHLSMEKPA